MIYSTTSTELQALIFSSTDWMILSIVTCVIGFGTLLVYRFYNENHHKTKKSVMIKIDRNGKHRYEIKEDVDNDRAIFWMKVVFFIIAIGLLCIPIHSWLYKS
ncbi:MAG: hypothetical protein ACSHWW_06880 [Nonlabens sp.]|uniref:hypothetical protein n=1 Tax=Nonlabens sp. TaxID=1888209 RepID=UPI003EF24F25